VRLHCRIYSFAEKPSPITRTARRLVTVWLLEVWLSCMWLEFKADGSSESRFAETGRDKGWIRLFDSSRDMVLHLPVGGGMCSWSEDAGKTWNSLYHVDKAK
jgi:hypothetical protein